MQLMRTSAILLGFLLVTASLCAQQIPSGTLLPAMLDNTLDSDHSKRGEKITAKLMQDVPLPDGRKIKRESKLLGHVVAVSPASSPHGASISVHFDQVDIDKRLVPVNLGLRALATMQAVAAARQPVNADSGIGTTGWDANIIQIGGQVAFNGQRIVKSQKGQVVGKVVEPGAVLGVPMANPDRGCLAPVGNTSDQAFWLFSTDACGVYGEEDMTIAVDGTAGQIVLKSPKEITLRGGSGWLLQAN
jgi:hypothetical protein